MKKSVGIITLVIIAILIILVLVTMKGKLDMSPSNVEVVDIYEDEINFFVHDLTDKSLKYTIVNNMDRGIIYDESYTIEKYVDGIWKSYNIAVDFIEIANIISPSKKETREIIFKTTYGSLGKGKFRLIKQIDGKYISAEFEI